MSQRVWHVRNFDFVRKVTKMNLCIYGVRGECVRVAVVRVWLYWQTDREWNGSQFVILFVKWILCTAPAALHLLHIIINSIDLSVSLASAVNSFSNGNWNLIFPAFAARMVRTSDFACISRKHIHRFNHMLALARQDLSDHFVDGEIYVKWDLSKTCNHKYMLTEPFSRTFTNGVENVEARRKRKPENVCLRVSSLDSGPGD